MLEELMTPKKRNHVVSKIKSERNNIPAWMRIASGVLGFLTSFLLVGLPAIALIIFDRVLPSGNSDALWTFLYLGLTTVVCVCLIELMRMKALQGYVVNVRGVIFFQDSCFAIFWAFVVGFIHPFLTIPSIVSAGILFMSWQFRKPLNKEQMQETNISDFEAEKIDACGLGPAFYEMAAQGKFASIQRLGFQTLGQWLTTSLLRRATFVIALTLSAWLVINNSVSMGTAVATVFLNQLNLEVFIRCYQVQSLITPRRDVSQLGKILSKRSVENTAAELMPPMAHILSIEGLKNDGFSPISADVFSGLCLTFIGPSGCGKSRILKSIATNDFEAGRVEFGGKRLDRAIHGARVIGYVPPSPINLPGTYVENVTGFEPQADHLTALELLMQLDPYEDVFRNDDLVHDTLENNFSTQGQLVSIARALHMDPPILIIDSPELFLDKASKAALLALILKAKTEGKIVLLATDDDYLMSAADEVIKLDRGIITDRGPMDEVLARHHERWVRVSFKPNKRDSFRLGLWLDAQLGHQFDQGFRERVKLGANDLLFLAPRDSFGNRDDDSLIDLKVGPKDVVVTLHDRGEILDVAAPNEAASDVANIEVLRLLSNTDQFQQRLKEGYRQITVRFSLDRSHQTADTAIGA